MTVTITCTKSCGYRLEREVPDTFDRRDVFAALDVLADRHVSADVRRPYRHDVRVEVRAA